MISAAKPSNWMSRRGPSSNAVRITVCSKLTAVASAKKKNPLKIAWIKNQPSAAMMKSSYGLRGPMDCRAVLRIMTIKRMIAAISDRKEPAEDCLDQKPAKRRHDEEFVWVARAHGLSGSLEDNDDKEDDRRDFGCGRNSSEV